MECQKTCVIAPMSIEQIDFVLDAIKYNRNKEGCLRKKSNFSQSSSFIPSSNPNSLPRQKHDER